MPSRGLEERYLNQIWSVRAFLKEVVLTMSFERWWGIAGWKSREVMPRRKKSLCKGKGTAWLIMYRQKQSFRTSYLHYVPWNGSLDEFKPIFSQEKKGGLNSEITPKYSPLCSLTMASLQKIQNNGNDSEEQGDRASPETFISLAKLVWQKMNFFGGTNSTEPLPTMHLHTFSPRAFSSPITDFPVTLKIRSGDGQIEYDWWKRCVLWSLK